MQARLSRRRLAAFALALPPLALPRGAFARHETLHRRHIVGYQGWFACPGDPDGDDWVHWFARTPDGRLLPTIDMLPDTAEFEPGEGCPTPWTDRAGRPVRLFTSQDARTVRRHFRWMAKYDIHGAAVQRFVSALSYPSRMRQLDRVLANVRTGAEAEGRSFFLMYDLSGREDAGLAAMTEDWRALVAQGLVRSPAYQWHRGGPVCALWGVGFEDRPLTPGGVLDVIEAMAAAVAPAHLTLLTGVPIYWRTGRQRDGGDRGWGRVHRRAAIISPWAVGAFPDRAGADRYVRSTLRDDIAFARDRGQDLLPVVFPGFSWRNLMLTRGRDLPLNAIPRECGEFYLHQARNALGAGASMIYSAMFDEVDEGTAIFKTTPSLEAQPVDPPFVPLNADGCALPSDWYLSLASRITLALSQGSPL